MKNDRAGEMAVAMIDRVVQKLEADLAALRTAREVLAGLPQAPLEVPTFRALPAAPPPTFGRDRDGTTALYAAMSAHAAELAPKACLAVKLRGRGKTPAEIAAAMKLTVKQVGNLLVHSRRKLIGRVQAGAPPAPAPADDADDEPEPARPIVVDEDRDDVPAILKTAAPGVNELLELRLEKIRGVGQAKRPPWATVGAMVVCKRDETGEGIFRVLAHLPEEMTRVHRCTRTGQKMGRRSWVLVPGELVRPADERRTSRGGVAYFVHAEAAS